MDTMDNKRCRWNKMNRKYKVQKIENFSYNGKTYVLPKGVWTYYDSENVVYGYDGYQVEAKRVLRQILKELEGEYSQDESVQAVRDWLNE